jgi:hypothetical protein
LNKNLKRKLKTTDMEEFYSRTSSFKVVNNMKAYFKSKREFQLLRKNGLPMIQMIDILSVGYTPRLIHKYPRYHWAFELIEWEDNNVVGDGSNFSKHEKTLNIVRIPKSLLMKVRARKNLKPCEIRMLSFIPIKLGNYECVRYLGTLSPRKMRTLGTIKYSPGRSSDIQTLQPGDIMFYKYCISDKRKKDIPLPWNLKRIPASTKNCQTTLGMSTFGSPKSKQSKISKLETYLQYEKALGFPFLPIFNDMQIRDLVTSSRFTPTKMGGYSTKCAYNEGVQNKDSSITGNFALAYFLALKLDTTGTIPFYPSLISCIGGRNRKCKVKDGFKGRKRFDSRPITMVEEVECILGYNILYMCMAHLKNTPIWNPIRVAKTEVQPHLNALHSILDRNSKCYKNDVRNCDVSHTKEGHQLVNAYWFSRFLYTGDKSGKWENYCRLQYHLDTKVGFNYDGNKVAIFSKCNKTGKVRTSIDTTLYVSMMMVNALKFCIEDMGITGLWEVFLKQTKEKGYPPIMINLFGDDFIAATTKGNHVWNSVLRRFSKKAIGYCRREFGMLLDVYEGPDRFNMGMDDTYSPYACKGGGYSFLKNHFNEGGQCLIPDSDLILRLILTERTRKKNFGEMRIQDRTNSLKGIGFTKRNINVYKQIKKFTLQLKMKNSEFDHFIEDEAHKICESHIINRCLIPTSYKQNLNLTVLRVFQHKTSCKDGRRYEPQELVRRNLLALIGTDALKVPYYWNLEELRKDILKGHHKNGKIIYYGKF